MTLTEEKHQKNKSRKRALQENQRDYYKILLQKNATTRRPRLTTNDARFRRNTHSFTVFDTKAIHGL